MMDDAHWLFDQTAKERKSTAASAFRMNRAGKGGVRFPSDYLSEEEKKKLNGDVKTVDLGKPMKWGEFVELPEELQAEYLRKCSERGGQKADICEMFGVTPHGMEKKTGKYKVFKRGKSGIKTDDERRAFREWAGLPPNNEKAEDADEVTYAVRRGNAIVSVPKSDFEALITKQQRALEKKEEAPASENDWINDFLAECCVRDANAKTRASALYEAYTQFAINNGAQIRRITDFNIALAIAGFRHTYPQNISIWRGVRLVQMDDCKIKSGKIEIVGTPENVAKTITLLAGSQQRAWTIMWGGER